MVFDKNTNIYWVLRVYKVLCQGSVCVDLILITVQCGRCYYFSHLTPEETGQTGLWLTQAPTQTGSGARALSWFIVLALETQVLTSETRGRGLLCVELDFPCIMSFQETKEEKSSYNCPLCEKICSTQHQLTMHIRQVCCRFSILFEVILH